MIITIIIKRLIECLIIDTTFDVIFDSIETINHMKY